MVYEGLVSVGVKGGKNLSMTGRGGWGAKEASDGTFTKIK